MKRETEINVVAHSVATGYDLDSLPVWEVQEIITEVYELKTGLELHPESSLVAKIYERVEELYW